MGEAGVRNFVVGALMLMSAACAPMAETPPEPPQATTPPTADAATAQDACGAAAHAAMVGTNIAAATFPEGVRVVGPDTIVTEDFRLERLNVLVDAQGVITGFRCY